MSRRLVRWAGRLAGGLILFILVLAGGCAAYQSWSAARALEAFPPPGELVDVGGHRLHLYCEGAGSPVVVLEAGLFGSSLDWRTVQPAVAKVARVCAYDRAGMGWSETGPPPRDSHRIADELHTLLGNADVQGPYVLVGHSAGGYHARVFAGRYPAEVAGVVLIDASHEALASRLPAAVRESSERQAGWFRVLPPMGRLGVARLIGMPMGMVAKYPEEIRDAAEAVGYQTRAFRAAAEEGLAFEASGEQAREARPLLDVPLIVVAANAHLYEPQFVPPGMSAETLAPILGELQNDLVRLSARGTLVPAEQSGHYVHLDQPALVIDAIRRVVEESRR